METVKEDNFIGIYDNVMTNEECQYIISEFDRMMELNLSKTYPGHDQFGNAELGRQDYAIFTNHGHDQITRLVNSKLDQIMASYSNEYWVVKNIKAHSLDVKVQKTPPRGGYHVWHNENGALDVASRVVTWMFYLNDVPEGEGETEFLWQKMRIQPKAGRGVLWPAAFTHTHRGNPVYSCDKYIVTGWYHYVA